MKNRMSKIILLLLLSISTQAQVLPLKEQAKVIDAVLENRLNQLLPSLMEKNGKKEISVMPVVDSNSVVIGLLRLHDLVQAGIS